MQREKSNAAAGIDEPIALVIFHKPADLFRHLSSKKTVCLEKAIDVSFKRDVVFNFVYDGGIIKRRMKPIVGSKRNLARFR